MANLTVLASLADALDIKGLSKEADELDAIIKAAAEEEKVAKEEKIKKERTTSKKVMKKFKRLKEAAESVCEGDVDTRGPYRELFDKARFGAQEICTLLKDIVFTEEGEKEADESGQIQENLAAVETTPAVPTVAPAPVPVPTTVIPTNVEPVIESATPVSAPLII